MFIYTYTNFWLTIDASIFLGGVTDLVGEEVDLEEVIEAAVHAEEPHLEERGPGGP